MRHPMEAPITHLMAERGRGGDTQVGHLTVGDVVIPREIALKDPSILMKLKKGMEEGGGDYRTHIVGSGYEHRNPDTGAPEFGFFSNIFKAAAPILGGLAGSFIPGIGTAVGSALGAGLGGLVSGAGVKGSLIDAAGAGLGSAFLGSGSGSLSDTLSGSSIPGASSIGGSLAGSALGNAGIQGLTGSLTGSSIANLVNGASQMPDGGLPAPNVSGPKNAALPTSAPKEASLPSSLSSFSSLDPLQQGTGIATQGLYGGGTSKDESDYFTNLLQRQLINNQGGYNDYSSNVNPTEESYLHNDLGLQFDPNTSSLLQAIANKQAAQPA